MNLITQFLDFIRGKNLEEVIRWGGYALLGAIVFAETGLLIGFFLPGDSLLMTAGVFAKTTGLLNIWALNGLLIVLAIVGDAVGYQIGKRAGPALFTREESLLFKPSHLQATKAFYEKHGGKTIVMARFMPAVRTFAPVIAGISGMPYAQFVVFNVIGAVGWVVSMTFLGYLLAGAIPPKKIELVIYLVIFLSILPLLIQGARRFLSRGDRAKG